MSFSASDISDGEEDHAMDNIRAMLQDYYGTDNGDEVKEEDYYDMDSKVFDKDKYIPVLLLSPVDGIENSEGAVASRIDQDECASDIGSQTAGFRYAKTGVRELQPFYECFKDCADVASVSCREV